MQGLDHLRGQNRFQISCNRPPRITRGWCCRGNPSAQEIFRTLNRAKILFLPHLVRHLFILFLKVNSSKRMAATKIAGVDCDHQPAVGVGGIMLGKAHAIGTKRPRFGNARHDISTRAHAKSEQVIFPIGDQTIICSSDHIF